MKIGNRTLGHALSAVGNRRNYRVLVNMVTKYASFPEAFQRYVFGKGEYPCDVAIRTPIGVIRPRLYNYHDMLTSNEIFCRLDYRAPDDVDVVVDFGSNIGLSALYFLTRNNHSRCYLYEPVPVNIERLRENIQGFQSRAHLYAVAVADKAGQFDFGVEETGRYGGLSVDTGATIKVDCLDVNQALGDILKKEKAIDILKIDTEGVEVQTIKAIKPEFFPRIKRIYFESDYEFRGKPYPLLESHFRIENHGTVFHLFNRQFFP